ncbi:hypothetical protein [Phocaeicola vulgatus]|jgi:hypothetical protein|uniref:hypothetical protein n=1 Tax=Phocaeicola vulgatus TaxID=821 RepID=UPI001E630765|nr:hypothetical protein [Phocaeicola vulgatus]MCG0292636.1 hypothetical protein [Phocaeicola vulgatus]
MRKIVFLLMLMLSNFAYSQKNEMHRVYCELLGSSKFLSTKVTVSIDFGQDGNMWESKLVDEKGKAMTFNSMVDAMNYMGRLGWKFEQAYVVTVGQQNVYHWLLSKEILENEAIKDGFETRSGYNETSK